MRRELPPLEMKAAAGATVWKLWDVMRIGRGDRIRTCDFYVPNVALYQTELHPD